MAMLIPKANVSLRKRLQCNKLLGSDFFRGYPYGLGMLGPSFGKFWSMLADPKFQWQVVVKAI